MFDLDTLSELQVQALKEVLDPKFLVPADGHLLHEFMVSSSGWTDKEEHLVFLDLSQEERNRFLYYMGAEREAELVLLIGDLAVYAGVNSDRLERFPSNLCKECGEELSAAMFDDNVGIGQHEAKVCRNEDCFMCGEEVEG